MNNPKIALSQALQGLADVARIVDSDDFDPNDVVIQRVTKQMLLDLDLPSTVDNCYQYQLFLKECMEHCASISRTFKAKKAGLEQVLANFRDATRLALSDGEKVAGTMASISVSDRDELDCAILTDSQGRVGPDQIESWQVPHKFLRVSYELNKTAIRDHLKAGGKLPWAKLTKKKSLRFNPRGSARGKK